jgi:hypothetical protein
VSYWLPILFVGVKVVQKHGLLRGDLPEKKHDDSLSNLVPFLVFVPRQEWSENARTVR